MRYKSLPPSLRGAPRVAHPQQRAHSRQRPAGALTNWLATVPMLVLVPLILLPLLLASASDAKLDVPLRVAPGERIEVRGSGFAGTGWVQLLWNDRAIGASAVRVARGGSFRVEFRVPTDASVGNHDLSAASVARSSGGRGRDVIGPVIARVVVEVVSTKETDPTPSESAPATPQPTPVATAAPTPPATPRPTTAAATPTPQPIAATPAPTPVPLPVVPSGGSAPIGDLPGWSQIFVDDFTTDIPLGSFPVVNNGRWTSYPTPWRDSSGNGAYSTARVVSVKNGVLSKYLHYADGDYRVAALMPVLPDGGLNQLFGRYAIRFRADPVDGYKVAWLLWPQSEVWPRDGEIDFPEGDLTGGICAFMHRQDALIGSDQDATCTNARFTDWHTAVIEWTPVSVKFYLDGQIISQSTSRIPNTPMRWVLQTETRLGSGPPPKSSAGNVQIDWVSIWRYAP